MRAAAGEAGPNEQEELEDLDPEEHGMHAYDLATAPGWLEQATARSAEEPKPAPATTLATSTPS